MGSSVESRVTSWVQNRIASPPPVVRLELHHGKTDSAPSVVNTWKVTARDQEASASLASAILAAAEEHASAFGKTQLYSLIAYASANRAVGEHPFRLQGTARSVDLSESEPPNLVGMLAQTMRHNEALMRMT